MQDDGSQRELRARHRLRCALAFGAALASGCATGVDVTEGEFAEICAAPNTTCGGGQGASVGNVGGSSSGQGGSASGGSFGANGGTGASTANGGSLSTGGTGGAVNGTSGSGGTGAAQPLAEGDCLPMSQLVIVYEDRRTGAASTNEPSMVLSVQNPSGTSFDLSTLTIRYWFTADGAGSFMGNIDYAQLDGQQSLSGAVQVSFGQDFGSDYAELSFTSTASVGAQGVNQVQLRFHGNPYQDMNQTNDFSFLSGAMAPTPNRNITPYLNGAQVGGCIPAGP